MDETIDRPVADKTERERYARQQIRRRTTTLIAGAVIGAIPGLVGGILLMPFPWFAISMLVYVAEAVAFAFKYALPWWRADREARVRLSILRQIHRERRLPAGDLDREPPG